MMMTKQKKLKQRIRARMERTGESYMTARRHVAGVAPGVHVGIHPDTSATARILGDAGVTHDGIPLTEALVLGVGGGLGAGYILWEFSHETDHNPEPGIPVRRVVTIGFRNNWQYPHRWLDTVLDRLGIAHHKMMTGGQARAADQLESALAAGRSAIVDVSAADLPYWHLPEEERGVWGYPIAVLGREEGALVVDDRNEGRLTVPDQAMSAARGRIPSWKNRMVTVDGPAEVDNDRLLAAVEAGLADAVAHLASKSTSFSLPAVAKWARMVDSDAAKGWKRVFADRQGLWGALRNTYEAVSDVGIEGGSLRPLFAEFLGQAAPLLERPALNEVADLYLSAADAWDDVGDATLPEGFEPLAEAVELSRRRREAVRRGDRGDADAAAAASALTALAREYQPGLPLGDDEIDRLFGSLSEAIEAAHRAERAAHSALSEVMTG
jgi:hypothetical protein